MTEARQIARLKHVNIVTVHDVVKEGAGYFLVTDLIDGETLAERLKRGPMSPAEAVKLLAEVARVIDYAHGQGVIHRDLKPAKAAGLLLTGSYESPQTELKSSLILAGRHAATVAQDRTIRVWTLKNQAELATLHGHTKAITAIAATENGEVIATASEDGTVRLWKIP